MINCAVQMQLFVIGIWSLYFERLEENYKMLHNVRHASRAASSARQEGKEVEKVEDV